MTRWTLHTLAVACGLLAGVSSTRADDPAQQLGRYRAEDKPIAADSPLTDDTEQIHHRGYYGGYRYPSYYGRSYYGGGGYYGGGFSFGYSSYYAPRYYAAPRYYVAPSYYVVPSYYAYPSSYYGGGYWGISGTTASGATLTLNLKPAAATAVPPTTVPSDPGFRYDGGPTNPVPQPTPDGRATPKAAPPAEADAIQIAVKPTTTAKPVNRYKAYGEK